MTSPNHVCSLHSPRWFPDHHHLHTSCLMVTIEEEMQKNKCIPSAREKITVDQNSYPSANSPIAGTISSTPTNKAIHGYLGCPEKWLYSWSLALERMVSAAEYMHWSAFLVLTLTTNKSAAQHQPDQHTLTAVKHPMGEKEADVPFGGAQTAWCGKQLSLLQKPGKCFTKNTGQLMKKKTRHSIKLFGRNNFLSLILV